MDISTRNISLVTWSQVKDGVCSVNKRIAELIDAAAPDNTYKFAKIDYLFGDVPIKNGVIQLPNKAGQLSPITSNEIDKKIQQELFYKNNPLFLVLEKELEVFIDTGFRIIPANLFSKGSLCCTYEAMDFMMNRPSDYNWSFAAGSRSGFMLPKITDKTGIQRLCAEFNIPSSIIVRDLPDHWELFKNIAQSKNFKQPWKCTILCFCRKWLENRNDSIAWRNLRDFFIEQAWDQAHITISRAKFGIQWEKYAEAITARRLKPKPYIFDQLKHLLSIASGDYPAFIPIDNSQEVAPSEGLEKAILDVYGLKDYFPTIMHPRSLKDLKPRQPFYYSLSHPTLLEGSPLKKDTSTIMIDLREIKLLIDTLSNYLARKQEQDDVLIHQTKFEYYHTENDKLGEIISSSKIPETDPYFLKNVKSMTGRSFCSSSSFFRGCLRISPNIVRNKSKVS